MRGSGQRCGHFGPSDPETVKAGNRIRSLFLRPALSIGAILLILVGGELGLRVVHVLRPPRAVLDADLGFRLNGDIVRRYTAKTLSGRPYLVHFSTGPNGFRFWDNPPGRSKHLLVVGDSYTEAYQVSDHKTWYWLLRNELGDDWNIFAFGCGGYGLLQEYLVIKKWFRQIQPDLVVWQWCANDLWNDSPFLDEHTIKAFNCYPRPYLQADGSIRIGCPHFVPVVSYHSKLWRWLLPRLIRRLRLPETQYDRYDFSSPHLRDALQRMDRILGMAQKILSNTTVCVFNVGGTVECNQRFESLARSHGYLWVGGVNEMLSELRSKGVEVDAAPSVGGHWCEKGHEVVARFLSERITCALRQPDKPPDP